MLHPRVATVWSHGTFVGYRLAEIDARIPEAVNTRKNLCPDHATEGLIARIGTTIINVARVDRGDDAIFVQCHSRVAEGPLVAVRARDDVLGARLYPLDGAAAGFF